MTIEAKPQQQERTIVTLFASDLLWDAIGEGGFIAAFFDLQRKRLQKLARRYQNRTDQFPAALERSMATFVRRNPEAHRRLMGILYYQERIRQSLQASNPSCAVPYLPPSQRQLRALDELFLVVQRICDREPVDAKPKRIADLFRQFAAKRPGPFSPIKEKILQAASVWIRGRKPTYGNIASQVFPRYALADGHERRHLREAVRLVLRDTKASQ
jgi:hypothetical protein